MKLDLCMWAKNGEDFLPRVLKRIDRVIPCENRGEKIFVDDSSTDNTRDIAEQFNWSIYQNRNGGIFSGIQTAFSKVKTSFFLSFEQDLLLAPNWWDLVPRHVLKGDASIASGVRVPNQPKSVHLIHEYIVERFKKHGSEFSIFYGKNMDNNIYNTKKVKAMGGFNGLNLFIPAVDTLLAYKIYNNNLKWKVVPEAKSIHLRRGLKEELKHCYGYGLTHKELKKNIKTYSDDLLNIIIRTILSPVRGLSIAISYKYLPCFIVYPLIRMAVLFGTIKSYLN
jgi:glycosyltransferase involved in cell wall biosynthesis